MVEARKARAHDAQSRTEEPGLTPDDGEEPKRPGFSAYPASLATIGTVVVTQFLARGDNAYLRGTGAFLLALAAISIFTPFVLLRKYGRVEDGKTYMQTRIVVNQGLYAIIRHPQYLGYMFLACGFALLSQHWVAVLLAVLGVTFFYRQVVREERYCLAQFGEPYERYLRRVPRFNIVLGIVRLWQRSNVLET